MKSKSRASVILASITLVLAVSPILHAASGDLTAVSAAPNWATITNWTTNPNPAPGTAAGDVVGVTSNITATSTLYINSISRILGTLNIGDSDNSNSFIINTAPGSGLTLTFDNSGTGAVINETGSVNDTLASLVNVILADHLNANVAGRLSCNGPISETSGAKNITKSGNGVLILASGSNSYSGVTAITGTQGGVIATANNALGTTAGNTTVASGTSLGISGGIAYSAAEGIVGSGAGSAVTGLFAAASRGFIQGLSGINSFAGAVQINATGTSRIGAQDGGSLTFSGPITMASGTTGVNVMFRSGSTAGDFITLTNTSNSWDGQTLIFTTNASTGAGLRLGANNALPITTTVAAVTSSSSGSRLDLAGYNQEINGLLLNTSSTTLKVTNSVAATTSVLTLNSTTDSNFGSGGVIEDGVGSVSVVKTGPAKQTLEGNNTFTGALKIDGGTLSITGLNRIGGATSTRAIQLGGGTLEYTYVATNAETSNTIPLTLNPGTSTISITGNYTTGGINAPTAPVTLRLGAPITGSGNLIKTGSGIFAIGQNIATTLGNTFTGTVEATAGALEVRNPDALGATSAGTTITNAQFEIFPFSQNAGVTFDAEPLTFSGNSYFRTKNDDTDSDIYNIWTGPITITSGSNVAIASCKQASLELVIPNTVASISPNISSLEISGAVTTQTGSTIKFGLLPSVVVSAVQSGVPQMVTVSGALTGPAAVETQGEATSLYTLAAPNYTGNTTVNGGILSLGAANPLNDSTTVNIAASGATLNLNFVGTDTVNSLYIGGVQQPAGVYEAIGNSGSGTEIAQITGSGTLTVTSGPAGGYSAWQSANSTSGLLDGDHDNDGVKNGTEYFLFGNTNSTGFTALPGVVNSAGTLSVTWTKAATGYTGTYGSDFVIETSATLANGSWTTAAVGTGPDKVEITGNNVKYIFPTGTKKFARLKVTGP